MRHAAVQISANALASSRRPSGFAEAVCRRRAGRAVAGTQGGLWCGLRGQSPLGLGAVTPHVAHNQDAGGRDDGPR